MTRSNTADEGRLTVVGSGTLFPSAARSSSAYHLEIFGAERGGSDGRIDSILLDCGSGTLHALARFGIDWASIDAVAVSHYHGDHVGDLASLLAAWRLHGRGRPLTLFGPADLGRYVDALAALHGSWVLQPGFPIRIEEIGPDGRWADPGSSFEIAARPTPHTDTSVAFRLSGSWGTLGYTGDTGPSDGVATFLAGCDVLVAECALVDPPAFEGHLTPSSLGDMAETVRAQLLLVTHVYPPTEPETIAATLRQKGEGRVEAAHDGMKVRISVRGADVDRFARGE